MSVHSVWFTVIENENEQKKAIRPTWPTHNEMDQKNQTKNNETTYSHSSDIRFHVDAISHCVLICNVDKREREVWVVCWQHKTETLSSRDCCVCLCMLYKKFPINVTGDEWCQKIYITELNPSMLYNWQLFSQVFISSRRWLFFLFFFFSKNYHTNLQPLDNHTKSQNIT